VRALPVRVDAVLVQALIAAALSFAHLHDLASAAGQHGWKPSWPASASAVRRARTPSALLLGVGAVLSANAVRRTRPAG
jgi:hypothetical protein